VALASNEREIRRAHLSDDVIEEALASDHTAAAGAAPPSAPHQSLDDLALEAITRAVDAANGNISEASRHLGISRNTIYRKLRWNRPRA